MGAMFRRVVPGAGRQGRTPAPKSARSAAWGLGSQLRLFGSLRQAGLILLRARGDSPPFRFARGLTAGAARRAESPGALELFHSGDYLVNLLQFLIQLPDYIVQIHNCQ